MGLRVLSQHTRSPPALQPPDTFPSEFWNILHRNWQMLFRLALALLRLSLLWHQPGISFGLLATSQSATPEKRIPQEVLASAISFLFLGGKVGVCRGSSQVREAMYSTATASAHYASILALPAWLTQVRQQTQGLPPDSGLPPLGVALVCKQPREVLTLLINQTPTTLGC